MWISGWSRPRERDVLQVCAGWWWADAGCLPLKAIFKDTAGEFAAVPHCLCGTAYAREILMSFPKTTASIPEVPCWSLSSVATLRGLTDPKAHWVLAGSGVGGLYKGIGRWCIYLQQVWWSWSFLLCNFFILHPFPHRKSNVWGWRALLALWASL